MKSVETLLACCVVGLACFIGAQAVETRTVSTSSEAAGAIDVRIPRAPARSVRTTIRTAELLLPSPRPERPLLDPSEMRRRIAMAHEGTYIAELLVARDSVMARWPERIGRPLRVFVGDGAGIDGWTADYLPAVRDAFDTWAMAGIPLRFSFTEDSTLADIHVGFLDRFPSGISGKTVWSRDGNYWLISSDIQLAIQHPAGGRVTPPQMRAIALHEVGHLLGLDHTRDSENIMAARVRVRELSEADKATVRLLYSVPAGKVR
jgi:hypothetical protein